MWAAWHQVAAPSGPRCPHRLPRSAAEAAGPSALPPPGSEQRPGGGSQLAALRVPGRATGEGGAVGGGRAPGTCPGRQGLPACPQGEIGSSVCRCPSVLLPQAPLSRRRQNTLPSEPPAALAPAEPGGGGSSCGCGHRGRAPRATGRARPDTCSCAVSCKQSQHSEQHFEVLRKWVKESHFVTCEQYSSLRPQGP